MALEQGGFIVSPRFVSGLATQQVFLGDWLDLLGRMVWFHEVAHLHMFVACIRLAIRCSHGCMWFFLRFVH